MKNFFAIIFLLYSFCSCTQQPVSHVVMQSGNEKIELHFTTDSNKCSYWVNFNGEELIRPSLLGFEFAGQAPLGDSVEMIKVTSREVDSSWTQLWGEQKEIRSAYSESLVELQEKGGLKRRLNLRFRLFNEGVAFRYEIPEQEHMQALNISHERTEFALLDDMNAWFIHANYDSYEALYQYKPIADVPDANTPITLATANKEVYVSLHEANLSNYAGMCLKKKEGSSAVLEANLVPWPDGIKVKTHAGIHSPWRTIQIAESPMELAESTLLLNCNEPNKIEDASWIRPIKYVGVWWEMHLGTHTWYEGERHGATTERMKEYIDFAAENNIDAVLAEGWNTGWENWGQPRAFDFVSPCSDFDLPYLVNYAREKGIQFVGHHETGGDVEYYEERMDTAFALYQSLGIHHLKTGYAGGIVPRGQHHHGQFMVEHYRRVVETAARYKLTINAHEPIKPTGIRRTWPNMMCREGARGMEWNGWSEGNPPEHHCILPFTRILAGPLDYTPGIFDLQYKNAKNRVKWNSNDRGNSRINTTLAKQLALFVVFYSPWQMASDQVANYKGHKAFDFIKAVPVNWEKTKYLAASIGEYVSVARKDRDGDNWYVGAISNNEGRTLTIALDFLDADATYTARIYKDHADSDWETNPYAWEFEEKKVTSTDSLQLILAPGGGQAIELVKR